MHASKPLAAGAHADGATASPDGPLGPVSRRSFLATGLAVGAGATLGPLGRTVAAFADEGRGELTEGDAAILRFLSAAEILETDLWQQYNELGGVQDSELPKGGGSKRYREALEKLDEDMPQYIHDNTEDEMSHFTFINSYLQSRGGEPVDLERFRTLPSSKASGAQQIGRLTNLMELTVDTSWWTRYRSSTMNPDLGDSFRPAVPGLLRGRFPAIPRSDADLRPQRHLQAMRIGQVRRARCGAGRRGAADRDDIDRLVGLQARREMRQLRRGQPAKQITDYARSETDRSDRVKRSSVESALGEDRLVEQRDAR